MKVPFLDLRRINAELDNEIHRAVETVIDSGWYILGKAGELFEEHCKDALVGKNEGHVVGCNSGTDALILSLLAAGVGAGDEVITVSHTAIPTISAVNAVGAKPVFIDIDATSWVMDINLVPPVITPATKAIIPVHIYGNLVDINGLKRKLSQSGREDICIIEDAAQAQGSRFSDRQAGTLGRFGSYSFYPSKNIGALGDGGAVFCHTVADMNALKYLRNYGQKDRYHAEIKKGINSRLDEIQAAILDIKLKHLDEWVLKKSQLMDRYRKALSGLPLTFQRTNDGCEPAWHLCVVALEDAKTRDALMAYLNKEGIQTLVHYPIPNHRQKAFLDVAPDRLPVTEDLATRILSLPFNTALLQNEVEYMMKGIHSFFA